LAIAAAKLGAGYVSGIDIDDSALVAAADNARKNGVTVALLHSKQRMEREFDIVVANILTNPLCVLAPLLTSLTRPGGRIALSGILEAQAAQVTAAYRPAFDLRVGGSREGWVLLEGIRGLETESAQP
jgi:ribosomal protein L11 methyltransferase